MNDVESGGATVFPQVKAGIKPVKGSAALWYNLFPNGQGNIKTRHSGCPVLAGSKMGINYSIYTFSIHHQWEIKLSLF